MRLVYFIILLPFILICQDQIIGDINCDGTTDQIDAQIIYTIMSGQYQNLQSIGINVNNYDDLVELYPCTVDAITGLTPDQLQDMINIIENEMIFNYSGAFPVEGWIDHEYQATWCCIDANCDIIVPNYGCNQIDNWIINTAEKSGLLSLNLGNNSTGSCNEANIYVLINNSWENVSNSGNIDPHNLIVPVKKGDEFVIIKKCPPAPNNGPPSGLNESIFFFSFGDEYLEDEGDNAINNQYEYGYIEYEYTGEPQMFIVPENTYTLEIECFGAAGGKPDSPQSYGLGGYIYGKYYCNPGDTLHIYVGGTNILGTGGWNGGGSSVFPEYYNHNNDLVYNYGGGGGSDVRLMYGGLDGSENVNTRIITAGGGSGSGNGGGNNIVFLNNQLYYGAGSTSPSGNHGWEDGGSGANAGWTTYGGGAGIMSGGESIGSQNIYPNQSGISWPELICYNEQQGPCSDIFQDVICGPVGNLTNEAQSAVNACYQLLLSNLTDGSIWSGGNGTYGGGGGEYGGGSSVGFSFSHGSITASGGSSYANPNYFNPININIMGGINEGNGKIIITW